MLTAGATAPSSGSASPLTTKGDVFGFGTANARIPVGTDGKILEADSSQTLGVGYSTHQFDFGGQYAHNLTALTFDAGPSTGFSPNEQQNVNINWSITGAFNGGLSPILVNPTITPTSTSLAAIRALSTYDTTLTLSSGLTIGEITSFHSQIAYNGAGQYGTSQSPSYTVAASGFQAEDVLQASATNITAYRAFYAWFQNYTTTPLPLLWGFHYSPQAMSSNPTLEWSFGADRGNAYYNGLTAFGTLATAVPAAVVNIVGTGWKTPTNLEASILDSHSRTVASNVGGVYGWLQNGTITVTSGQGLSGFGGGIGLRESWALNASLINFAELDIRPTIAGSTAPANSYMMYFAPTINLTPTASSVAMLQTNPEVSSTITTLRGLSVGGGNSTLVTTNIGLDIGVNVPLFGTTLWGMQVGNYQSYHQGPFAFGGTSAPTWNMHSQGSASAKNALGIDVSTTAPTAPPSSASATTSVYKGSGGNTYYLVAYNDAGTMKYFYFKLNGASSITWTFAASLPT
jgi:hypothetical protein